MRRIIGSLSLCAALVAAPALSAQTKPKTPPPATQKPKTPAKAPAKPAAEPHNAAAPATKRGLIMLKGSNNSSTSAG